MTPQEFIAKWRSVELKERSASQSHFNDLCRLLDLPDPISADPKGDWFAFEQGAAKAGGGEGWADVWRKDCFGWEYKGKRKDLKAALNQLLGYSQSLGSPPLLIVSDTDRIEIHTNWNNTVQKTYHLSLDDLLDAGQRDILRACFTNPDRLKPQQTRQDLTEEAAQKFVAIAERLRQRGHPAQAVAHFVNRLVFCMFAEDVDLLPEKLFSQMIDESLGRNAHLFQENAATLFDAMSKGKKLGFKKIEWFNGGLFDTDEALPLTYADIDDLKRAAFLNWSDIDPSIMGTLFERGLDPDKRSQLGAHYTDRDKIDMIVRPVIVQPLLAEWDGVLAEITALITAGKKGALEKAQTLKSGFLERLARFRVLDPACGSGNFLYVALQALKDIEHKVNLDAEALGLQRDLPRTGPENMLGIELNPYAAELARVSVWVGDIQWVRRNGGEVAKNPILRTLDTIQNRDAVLNADGTRADWPKADVVVGNPPFLGGKKLLSELGADYVAKLRAAYSDDLSNFADLVCFWFVKAWSQIKQGKLGRAGLVTTNSIRGGANREALKPIVDGGRIFVAWSDEDWTLDGAAVRVSMVCFDGQPGGYARLDDKPVPRIFSDLTGSSADTTAAARLPENAGRSFVGIQKTGDFNISGDLARQMLAAPTNPNGRKNSEVLRPYWNGIDLTRRPQDIWLIDFPLSFTEADAALFEMPFAHLIANVQAIRATNAIAWLRDNWWLLWRARPDLRAAVQTFDRFIVTPEVSKHRVFAWMPKGRLPDKNLTVIARDDDTTFGILHSRFHELWALRMGTFLGVGNDPRYTPSTTFETFPFPEGLTPNIPAAQYAADPRAQAIALAAARLNELRENWLNPPDLVIRTLEVVPGYPDRILPKDAAAEAILKKRTLTNLYNTRPAWLDHAHKALDEAVANAYGWADDWRAGTLTDDEILARLFRLNQERAKA